MDDPIYFWLCRLFERQSADMCYWGYGHRRCSRLSPREPPGLARSSFPKNVSGWGYTPLGLPQLMS